MDLQLTDKVAIVTGSSKGLGLAAARALLAEGASVAICARGREALKKASESLRDLSGRAGAILDVEADVSTASGCERVVKETLAHFGRIDVLVNNVGKAGGGDIVSTSDDEWQSAIDQTLFPAVRMSRLVVPEMRKAGGGVIVMIASIWGRDPADA